VAKSKFPTLTAVLGSSKGKRFILKKPEYACGSGRKCQVRLKGEFVSELHFTVRTREDGNWAIQNSSEYGTLVNAQRVETRVLSDGDKIQIGTGNVLVFNTAGSEEAQQLATEDNGEAGSGISSKTIAIAAGVAIYLAGMFYAITMMTGSTESSQGGSISISQIDSAVSSTMEYMKIGSSTDPDKAAAPANTTLLSVRYFRILELQAGAGSRADLDKEYEALEQDLRSTMYAAYKAMATGQTNRSIELFDEIYARVPDIRAPVTAMALTMRSQVGGTSGNE
jgi:pSer/pThr/pTyr-binding forkhead associated (FHA) protein